ncbi:bifunctional helix-turn-helix transcriptional regulator/GNAT family N-acetyltransferase [Shewanella sp. Isolate11]|uniref:bifunctional helix-turn-helix transcriptional regulator/GNAT family N-acetyltransferase n=1 Tax=Shewanella sp. Isolate11 TaxID=2908530 RepID=UPI001EFD5CA9|nr:bifunctional helix-turn-helix transcriptional regulator/GNAT family N-acetyltransferase [Shewanella sp. Isolate11]MCG9695709.1 bifunctional helix-turn-helix transcriptional regulator/GNAT family N-acetyltransferase [Shewanella sp. Isolate11]
MTHYCPNPINDAVDSQESVLPQTCTSLRSLSRSLAKQLGLLDSVYGDLPLSPVQAHAIIEMDTQALSIKQLASCLNIDKSNASRAVSQLCEKGYATTRNNPRDSRSSLCQLTPQGKRQLKALNDQQNQVFEQILAQLSQAQIDQLTSSLTQYSRAIEQAKMQQGFTIRSITTEDNPHIARVIRQVSAEYGLTPDKGYGVADPTLDNLYQVYQAADAHYWIIEAKNRVYGGAGIAPLAGNPGVCELQKMYFDSNIRGKGFAKRLALQALTFARAQGYSHCYLETTACLQEAIKLYEKLGFEYLQQPLGNTGHDACELPMMLKL